MIYDHTNPDDIERLLDNIRPIKNMSTNKKAYFYAMVIDKKLMRGPTWIHVMVWFIGKIRGFSRVQTWHQYLNVLGQRNKTVLNELIDELMRHIRHGKDKVDPRSVGGFNGDEMIIISEILNTVKR